MTGLSHFCALPELYAQVLSRPMDVVFDLDWTVIYPTSKEMAEYQPENIVKHGEDYFRLADHLIPVLQTLHQLPDVRISFFSGGAEDRNKTVIEEIYRRLNARGSRYAPYRILHHQHLLVASTNSRLRFPERLKKDLAPYFDLEHVVLIDDIKEFAMPGQEKNILWLSKTYNDRPLYELKSLEKVGDAEFSAPTYEDWLLERRKILNVLESLLVVHRWRDQMYVPEALHKATANKVRLCRRLHRAP